MRKSEAINETIKIQSINWCIGEQAFLVNDFTSKEMDTIPKKVLRAVNITKTRLGLYFTFTEGATLDTSTYRPHEINALDPGVRTFMTGHYADGVIIEWGAGDMNRIYAMLRLADKLYYKMDKWKNAIATYKDELTKEHPEVKRRTVELARLNAVKAQLTKFFKRN